MEEKVWTAVSPKHYKDVVPGLQYMQMMKYMLDGFEGDEAHLMGQIYKYLMRYGKKDAKNQELGKVYWYLCYLMLRNGMDEIKLHGTLDEIAGLVDETV
jgi:hypothetical protein